MTQTHDLITCHPLYFFPSPLIPYHHRQLERPLSAIKTAPVLPTYQAITSTTPNNQPLHLIMSPSYTIVMGCDNAGCEYKTALKADLEKDPRVKAVIDVGVNKGQEDYDTAYPHIGVAVGRTIAEGKADRGLLICGTGASFTPWCWVDGMDADVDRDGSGYGCEQSGRFLHDAVSFTKPDSY